MSLNIPSWYVSQYSTNIQLLLQQKGSRLRQAVMSGSHVGSQAAPVDQIGAISANVVTGVFNPMPRTDAILSRRWVMPTAYDVNQLIDTFEKLEILTDPMGQYVTNATYALGRSMDDAIIAAFHGTSNIGVNGTSTEAWSSTLTSATGGGNVVSVLQGSASASGLTVAKLREAKRQLMANEVDLENDPLFAAVTAKQHDDLLKEAQVIDLDYTDKPVLVEGKVTRFLGINFIHTERLLTGTDDNAGTGSTAVPLWSKSGMYLGNWMDIKATVSQRHDLQGEPFQAYCKGMFGGSRLDLKRVLKVWCA